MLRTGERGITPRDLYRAIGVVTLLAVIAYYFQAVTTFLLLAFTTVLVAILLFAGAEFLKRFRIPRAAGVLITLLVVFGVLAGLSYAVLPSFLDQLTTLLSGSSLSNLQQQLQPLLSRIPFLSPGIIDQALGNVTGVLRNLLPPISQLGGTLLTALGGIIVVLISAVYMAIRPEPLVNGFLRLFPGERRERVREVLNDLHETLIGWLLGLGLSMLIIGTMSLAAFWLIGVPFAMLFGVLSGLLEIVPYFGPWLTGIIVGLVTLATLGVTQALLVVVALIIIQQIETNIVIPLVMAREVHLHPAVVALGVVLVGYIFGFLGILVAVPILAATNILLHDLWMSRMDQQKGGLDKKESATPG